MVLFYYKFAYLWYLQTPIITTIANTKRKDRTDAVTIYTKVVTDDSGGFIVESQPIDKKLLYKGIFAMQKLALIQISLFIYEAKLKKKATQK